MRHANSLLFYYFANTVAITNRHPIRGPENIACTGAWTTVRNPCVAKGGLPDDTV